ncbi:MAG: hypothetical protein KatS3mg002_0965 [Candidatus Woesearchaeota archaeon]|nr:MAG: hypothetical protein KatS3mg002_0965 [Candidatus Woesearchaeota archaeon]
MSSKINHTNKTNNIKINNNKSNISKINNNKIINNVKKINNKKSQITIFVAIGLIIIIIISLIVYLRSGTLKIKPPVDNLEVTDEVKPIQTYVINCLEETSKEALIKAGQNGGYIKFNGRISLQPYNSDALIFEPQVLPYWYHLRECSSSTIGCLDSFRPPLCDEKDACVINSKGANSIEKQLSEYINENIERCLDFTIFENLFDIKRGPVDTTVIVRENNVEFLLRYPLEIRSLSSGHKTEISYFIARHNVKLKEIYELATEITQQEIDTNFLELQTMNLVTIYSGMDTSKLPPLSRVELSTNVLMWTRSRVKDILINDVLPFMSFIRIIGTINDWQLMSTDLSDYSIYADGIYNSMEYNLNNKTYDLYTNFIYPYSDIYLDFGGSEILRPDEYTPEYPLMRMAGLFIKEYKFKYDISYPLIVRITDPDAFNGEGYTFDYALEVNIRKNVPVKGNLSINNLGGTGSIRLDSEIQKVNRTITVRTIDAHTKEPLEDVYVYYSCGNQYLIGKTKMKGNYAEIAEKFPFCQLGGLIFYEKPGYMSSAIEYNNVEGSDPQFFEVKLWPIIEKEVEVLKRTPENVEKIRINGIGEIYKQAERLSENQTVLMSISRVKTTPYDMDIPQVGLITITGRGNNVNLGEEQKNQIKKLYDEGKIDKKTRDELLSGISNATNISIVSIDKVGFVPGTYEVNAFIIYNGNITIPKEIRKECGGIKILGKWCTNTIRVELPEQNFTTFANGGAKFNFTLTERDVYGQKNKIIFYVLEQPIPRNWLMLENYPSLDEYQKGKDYLLRPRLE